ncbi:hypothetical protein M758_3G207800 [Ceratodon purpureus]|uniref:Folylpolyglutamate synthase n=1 Tax=Ceratodon purpureus TaxID=3225 RepID=A0A8T0IPR3_CERPU|nr:hypothetical protein KC19_3G208000 [Ceratodon purpureus]KAG0623872.1 hypothetical protein M758_3G207800 [Ceratodon purpureus]
MADAEAAMAQSRSCSRTYEDAIAAMNTLITRKADMPPPDPRTGELNWNAHFQALFRCIEVLELEDALSRLSVIHVAGTKGKGSTCAFTERMLRESGFRTGLFTSPHLLDVRERFRFNGEEIAKDRFLYHFWWCWDRLKADNEKLPGFFRFCTLLGLKMFTAEKVDVAILEVGLGGRLDATNVVKSPVACGIASLGYDHMELLGNTLAEIAREKAGIFKAGVPAFTAPQQDEAMGSLQKRATELGITLEVVPALENYELHNLQLGLGGEHQRINAALAVALCKQWVMTRAPSEQTSGLQKVLSSGRLPDSFVKGLQLTKWAGRAEVIHDPSGRLSFYLDGAHSPESMEACANWFCSTINSEEDPKVAEPNNGSQLSISGTDDEKWNSRGTMVRRVLLFNCMPKRDPVTLLQPVVNLCSRNGFPLHAAFFVPPYSSYTSVDSPKASATQDTSWQQLLQRHWESIWQKKLSGGSGVASLAQEERREPQNELLSSLKTSSEGHSQNGNILGPSSAVIRSLPAAVDFFRNCSNHHPQLRIQVLVTGSLYLVGDLLRLLKH